jgi:CheY-like chemotaxis protein
MSTQSTRTLVDEVAEEAVRTDSIRGSDVESLRAQAAFVRALVDQVDSYHPENPIVGALHDQLSDELDRLARMASASNADAVEATRPVDVLVVDDNAAEREGMRLALKTLGYPCRVAASGEEGLAEFEREPAAMVLSDWSMPGMSGLELCIALKRREPPPYVIVATGFPDKARLLEGMRDNADDFVTKPVDFRDLEGRLAAGSRLIRAVRLVKVVNERLRAIRPAT